MEISMAQQLDPQVENSVRNFTGTIGDSKGDLGSGFVADINNNIATIVTNQHVVRASEDNTLTVTLRDAQTQEYFTVKATAENIKSGENIDAATLKLDLSTAVAVSENSNITGTPRPEVATFADAKVGETVFPVGKPHNAEGIEVKSFKTDFILGGDAGQKGLEQGYNIGYRDDDFAHGKTQEPDVIIKGMSGGPTVNEQGEVIGINGRHAYPLWETILDTDVKHVFQGTEFEQKTVGKEDQSATIEQKLDTYNASIHPENLLKEFPELAHVVTSKKPEERLSLSDNYVEKTLTVAPEVTQTPVKTQEQVQPESEANSKEASAIPEQKTAGGNSGYDKDVIDALRDANIALQSQKWQTTTDGQKQVVNNLEAIIEHSHEHAYFDAANIDTNNPQFVSLVQSFLGLAGHEITGQVDPTTLEKLNEFRDKYGVDANAPTLTREDVNMMNALQSARHANQSSELLSFTDTDFANVAASPIYDAAQNLQQSKNAGTALF
jgi:Trypsin-like peptidase domain